MVTRIAVYIAIVGVLIYFVLILREVRDIVEDAKDVVKVGRDITTSIASPVKSLAGLLESVTKGVNAIRSITDIFGSREEGDYED